MIAVFGEGAIRAKRAVYAEHDVTLSNEETMDEIVADFSGKLLTDEGTIRSMASTDRSFARKIMDIIRDVAQRIKEALGWADPTMDRAAQLWENALRAAEKQAGKSQKKHRPGGRREVFHPGKPESNHSAVQKDGRRRSEFTEEQQQRCSHRIHTVCIPEDGDAVSAVCHWRRPHLFRNKNKSRGHRRGEI